MAELCTGHRAICSTKMSVTIKDNNQLSETIKKIALEEGFDACGIAPAHKLQKQSKNLEHWLQSNYNGSMGYMANYQDKRDNPSLLFDNCKSVISLAINYFSEIQFDQNQYIVSKYALGKDYHLIIKKKLKAIISKFRQIMPEGEFRAFVDTAPVLERDWAVLAGLGWIGKNTCFIMPGKGSFYFLAEVFATVELDYDKPFEKEHCGNCQKCINACPTKAIVKPGTIDARKCISYLTIESKEPIPAKFKESLSGRIWGCDICQDVCPWNKKFAKESLEVFTPSPAIVALTKNDWRNMTKEEYDNWFKNPKTAISRASYEKLKDNISSQQE